MTLTTPVKVVSGVAAASTAVAGSAVAYKYALDVDSVWKIKSETNPNIVIVSATATAGDLATKYEVTAGWSWTCKLNLDSSKHTGIKDKLKKYFGVSTISSDEQPISSITKENKVGFANSCFNNRKESSNNKVVSEIEIGQYNIDSKLEEVFGKNLNQVEIKAYSSTGVSLSASSFTLGSNNKKVTGTITASNKDGQSALRTGESWVCTIEGIFKGTGDLSSSDVTNIFQTQFSGKLSSEEDKWGLVNSCARSRTSSFGDKKVTSILRLNISKESAGNTLKFDETQINQVFKGTWVNPAA